MSFLAKTRLMREVVWKYRYSVLAGLGTLIVVDGLEALPPVLLKLAIDCVTGERSSSHLDWIAGAFLLITIIQGFCRYGWRILLIRSSLLRDATCGIGSARICSGFRSGSLIAEGLAI